MTAIQAKTERKRQDRSIRRAEKRSRQDRMRRVHGPIRPAQGVCATPDTARGVRRLFNWQIQGNLTSDGRPLGECWILENQILGEDFNKIFSLPYHKPAFVHLEKLFKDEINYGLTQKYALVRGDLFLSEFKPGVPIESQRAWDFVKRVLDLLDAKIGEVLSQRSVFYWLHLYRRIGVLLSPEHEDKTDAITTGLVRQIVELAIQKHGRLEGRREFGNSKQLSPNLILGGWMKKGIKALGGKAGGEDIFQKYIKILRSEPTLVLREFGKKDFLGIYEVEGAAYQYWRLTALLRSLGKGATIQIDESGDWNYLPNFDLSRLITSIDERNESVNDFSSRLGVWVDDEILTRSPSENDVDDRENGDVRELGEVLFPIYNVRRVDLGGLELQGAKLPKGSITNFFPYFFHVGRFLDIHGFMEIEFVKRNGYDFKLLLRVLSGLSSFSILPQKALLASKEDFIQKAKIQVFMQTLYRGYQVFVGSSDDLCQMLADRIELLFGEVYQIEQLRGIVASLSLDNDQQSHVSLWSGGPRAIIIPSDNMQIVDFVCIPSVLSTLFVFMPDRIGDSGTVFEQLFRDALKRRGFSVDFGCLFSDDGKQREMDAGVQIGECLYLFECVSIERPLDLEIGRPKSIRHRIERLEVKLEQAEGLSSFIRQNPVGKNYDYSTVERVEHFVVSPFVEWVWDYSSRLWSDLGFPRFVSPSEAFSILEDAD